MYMKEWREGYKICGASNAINGGKSNIMSGVKKERADNGKYEKSVGSLKEPTCQQREVHAVIRDTRSLMSGVIIYRE